MAAPAYRFYSVEEYFALEESFDERYELIGGHIYMMAGGTPWHDLLVYNLTVALGNQLRGGECRGHTSSQRVSAGDEYVYPDFSVSCGQRKFGPKPGYALLNPIAVFEVLPPSTDGRDRGDKFVLYRFIESVQDYFLVSQARMAVDHYIRQTDGRWLLQTLTEHEDKIELSGIAARVLLSDLYGGVSFESLGLDLGPDPDQ